MASYADYTYYTGTFHGSTIASTEFANLAIRASAATDPAVSVGDVIEVAEFSSSKAVAVGYVTVTADVIG